MTNSSVLRDPGILIRLMFIADPGLLLHSLPYGFLKLVHIVVIQMAGIFLAYFVAAHILTQCSQSVYYVRHFLKVLCFKWRAFFLRYLVRDTSWRSALTVSPPFLQLFFEISNRASRAKNFFSCRLRRGLGARQKWLFFLVTSWRIHQNNIYGKLCNKRPGSAITDHCNKRPGYS